MAPRPNRPIWTWCQNWRRPHSMKSVVRPELSTAAAGPSQAPTAALDNSAPRSTPPEPTYKSGKTVQLTGTTYDYPGCVAFLVTIMITGAYVIFDPKRFDLVVC